MNNYRLSALRSKGWVRLGLTVALAAIPLAIVEHALGVFSEGLPGLWQAAEFAGGIAAIALVLSTLAGWVVHGFAVRTHDDEAGHEPLHGSLPSRPANGPAAVANLHGRPAPHH